MALKRFLITCFVLMVTFGYTQAQDVSFSQFYANPVYQNPAMAGLSKCAQIHLHYRNQWPSLERAYNTYHISYDQYIKSMNSGFAFMITSDHQADGVFTQNQYSGVYDYQFQVSRDVHVSLGIQFTLGNFSINPKDLTFYNNGTIQTYDVASTSNPVFQNFYITDEKLSRSYSDFSTGAVVGFMENYYVGAAVHHLNQPNISFYQSANNTLDMKYTLQAGAIFFKQNSHYSKETVYLSPNLFFQQQGNFRQLSMGLYAGINSFVVGSWYRHNFSNPDALVFLLGFRKENLKFGYSYDLNVSGLKVGPSGSHEISLSWDFCVSRAKKRRIRTIKCPSF